MSIGSTSGKEPDHIEDGDLRTPEQLRGDMKEIIKAKMSLVERAYVQIKHRILHNEYGPTETTVWSHHHRRELAPRHLRRPQRTWQTGAHHSGSNGQWGAAACALSTSCL